MKKNHTGFTLIELLAVVLIIAMLTSVALPQYRKSVQRAESMEALVNLRTIFDAAKRYRSANSEAPMKLNGLDVSFFDADTPEASSFNIGNYHYIFSENGVSACRISGSGSFADTYCLNMYYTYRVGDTKYKDLLTCASKSPKYSWLCDSLKTDDLPDGTAVIGTELD